MANKRRFYRANLAAVVWDAERNRSMAEFIDGQFITTNKSVADKLLELGYPEVDLKTENPPDFIAPKGSSIDGDVPVIPASYGEGAALNKQKAAAALKAAATTEGAKQKPKSTRKVIKRRKS